MGDIISTVKKSVAGLTGVAVCLLALGVVMGVLMGADKGAFYGCLLYTSPSPRD